MSGFCLEAELESLLVIASGLKGLLQLMFEQFGNHETGSRGRPGADTGFKIALGVQKDVLSKFRFAPSAWMKLPNADLLRIGNTKKLILHYIGLLHFTIELLFTF